MSLRVITLPTELITVATAAAFMRIDFPDSETAQIEAFITASRQFVENYLFRAIGAQTNEIILPYFPSNGIILRPPISSVASIKYYDANDNLLTLDSSEYIVITDADPGIVIADSSWPGTVVRPDAVRVRFETGYTDPSDSPYVDTALPKSIETAMLMLIADMYDNREAQVETELKANKTVVNLLSMYRLEMGL